MRRPPSRFHPRRIVGCATVGLAVWRADGPAPAQVPLPPPRPVVSPAPAADAAWVADPALPIDLLAALRLAATSNLDIVQARQVVEQTLAARDRARAAWLPTFAIGSAYNQHQGQIQATNGDIQLVDRSSLFYGGTLSGSVAFGDAIFLPLAARQGVRAGDAGLQRVTNDTLLAVAEAYLNVLRGRRRLARLGDVLEVLISDRPSPQRGQSKGLLPLVRDIVEAGARDAFRSELARVQVEVLRRQEERAVVLQDLRLAEAELARLLRLDPRLPLAPTEDFRVPMPMPGEAWLRQDLEVLVALALNNRPELAENQALVRIALDRLRAARYRPWLPTLAVGYSAGEFGGGPNRDARGNFVSNNWGTIGRIDDRTDFDVSLTWRFQNLGLGNLAEVREARAIQGQAEARLLAMRDRVVAQVVQAYEQVQRGRERVALTRMGLFNERMEPRGPAYESLRLSFDRIRAAEGRPLEALDSIRGLNDLLDAYALAVTDLERAQFRLLIALGLPPTAYLDPRCMPPVPGSPPVAR